uniref:Uncharacterized protein n=1 Tax=Photinus pyralis TaxID=7054 RepID=A0A1Y1KMI3_PHOPY
MAERHMPRLMSGEEKQRLPSTPRPASSTLYVPPAGQTESISVHPAHTHDKNVDGELAPPLGEIPGSGSGSTELGNTARPVDTSKPSSKGDQRVISDYENAVNYSSTDIPDVIVPQDSQSERAHQEESHDGAPHERKSTRSRSPSSPLSPTDDGSGTDATDYGEEEGMDAADGLPDWRGGE